MNGNFRYFSWSAKIAWGCVLLIVSASAGAQSIAQGAAVTEKKGTAKDAFSCIACHGAKGEGNAAAGFPRLAGLAPDYIEEQLAYFASGGRQNAVMQPIAKALTPTQRTAVASYYSLLPGVSGITAPNEETLKPSDTGAWLALHGRWDQELPACTQCHGPGGAGVGASFPPLAGQSSVYIAAQLHAFKNGTRPGGAMNLMTVVAKKLTEADITAVADYFGAPRTPVSTPDTNKGKK